MPIQIQHLLKLNPNLPAFLDNPFADSNTTLVKVKYKLSKLKLHHLAIQIQHLLKLNLIMLLDKIP